MKKTLFFLTLILLLNACQNTSKQANFDVNQANWQQIEDKAKGSTVQLTMWQGDPLINKYMVTYVVPELKKLYDIDLKINGGQGNDLVKLLMSEKEGGKSESSIDMGWINGETFFQLRQINGLFGPFTDKLPNAQLKKRFAINPTHIN